MSRLNSDDLETTGYFLPEDSQLRLTKLREYVEFLANLARPRTADEEKEYYAEIRPSEVAICMEVLEEQIGLVLDELSWPAERGEREAAAETDAEPEAAEPEALEAEGAEPEAAGDEVDNAGARYAFGLTLDQIDEIELLLAMVMAHGDVVISADDGEFARNTMSQMGQAIFTDAKKLREIIHDVNDQRLRPPRHVLNRVGEEPAVYHAGVAYLPAYRASHAARPLPARRKKMRPEADGTYLSAVIPAKAEIPCLHAA
jgi:hypothetical protein